MDLPTINFFDGLEEGEKETLLWKLGESLDLQPDGEYAVFQSSDTAGSSHTSLSDNVRL